MFYNILLANTKYFLYLCELFAILVYARARLLKRTLQVLAWLVVAHNFRLTQWQKVRAEKK